MKRTFELTKQNSCIDATVAEIVLDTKKMTNYIYNQLEKERELDDIIKLDEYYKNKAKSGYPLYFPRFQVRLDNGFEYEAYVIYSKEYDRYTIEPTIKYYEEECELCRPIYLNDKKAVQEFRKTYELIAEVFIEIRDAKQDMLSALCKAGK